MSSSRAAIAASRMIRQSAREEIVGIAVAKEVRVGRRNVRAKLNGFGGRLLLRRGARPTSSHEAVERSAALVANDRGTMHRVSPIILGPVGWFSPAAVFQCAGCRRCHDQFWSRELTGAGTSEQLHHHTTTTGGVNRLMIVGVSMNIANSPPAGVVGVTYNGATLSLRRSAQRRGGHAPRGNVVHAGTRQRGTTTSVVNVNIPAAATVGVVAGVTTLPGRTRPCPWGHSSRRTALPVPVLAVGYPQRGQRDGDGYLGHGRRPDGKRARPAGPAVEPEQREHRQPRRDGRGSTRTGAPSVPMSETFSGTSNWSLGAVWINPSTADIGVTTSVSAVPVGTNSVYNITVFNNGPSAATGVSLTDTYAATGLALVSVTPGAGTTCPTTAPRSPARYRLVLLAERT